MAAELQLADVQAILSNLVTELKNETAYRATNGPKPSYNLKGRQVQWNEYLAGMRQEIRLWQEMEQSLDLFEVHEHGY